MPVVVNAKTIEAVLLDMDGKPIVTVHPGPFRDRIMRALEELFQIHNPIANLDEADRDQAMIKEAMKGLQ